MNACLAWTLDESYGNPAIAQWGHGRTVIACRSAAAGSIQHCHGYVAVAIHRINERLKESDDCYRGTT